MIDFDKMDREELRKYLDFLMRNYRLVDAFWYIYLEEEHGSETANRFNERVWERIGELSARDILKRFEIQDKGLDGLVKAIRYYPWTIIVGYQIERNPDEILLSVPNCPTQISRLRRQLGEYDCREMHRREFVSFSHVVDPAIMVECLHAPPDPHPPDRFCQWRFTVP